MTTSPVLFFHVVAGACGLLLGAATLYFRKGSELHQTSGKLFVITMLSMATSAVYLSSTHSITFLGGMLTCYLVATGWMTLRRKPWQTGVFEIVALLVVLAVSTRYFMFGMEAAQNVTGKKGGIPAGTYYFFGSAAALCAALDIRMLWYRGISGKHRIARHLWRMCFALFMAAGAFFLGQEKIFPDLIRETQAHYLPLIAIVVLMIYWLFRIWLGKQHRKT